MCIENVLFPLSKFGLTIIVISHIFDYFEKKTLAVDTSERAVATNEQFLPHLYLRVNTVLRWKPQLSSRTRER